MNTEDLYDHDIPNTTITLFEDLNYWMSYHTREFLISNHHELFLYSMNKNSYTFVNLPDNYAELFYKSGIVEFYYELDNPSYFYMIRDEMHSMLGILWDDYAEELLNIIFDTYYNSNSDYMEDIVIRDGNFRQTVNEYYNNYPYYLQVAYRKRAVMTQNYKKLIKLLNMTEEEFFKDIPEENLLGVQL